MRCIKCDAPETLVTDSRPNERAIRRRRRCPACAHRFTTWEAYDIAQLPDHGAGGMRAERRALIEATKSLSTPQFVAVSMIVRALAAANEADLKAIDPEGMVSHG